MKLRVSIVTHALNVQILQRTLMSLEASAARLNSVPLDLVLINNGPDENEAVLQEMVRGIRLTTHLRGSSGARAMSAMDAATISRSVATATTI